MRTMLVDDSKTMRNIEKGILAQLGFCEIEEACDGVDALSKISAFEPELVLVDWNMPNMDGLSFVRHIRARGHKAMIIMVTTETEKKRVAEAIKAGVNNYVVKPFTPDTLSARIMETLERVHAA